MESAESGEIKLLKARINALTEANKQLEFQNISLVAKCDGLEKKLAEITKNSGNISVLKTGEIANEDNMEYEDISTAVESAVSSNKIISPDLSDDVNDYSVEKSVEQKAVVKKVSLRESLIASPPAPSGASVTLTSPSVQPSSKLPSKYPAPPQPTAPAPEYQSSPIPSPPPITRSSAPVPPPSPPAPREDVHLRRPSEIAEYPPQGNPVISDGTSQIGSKPIPGTVLTLPYPEQGTAVHCPHCNLQDFKEIEDRSRILSYVPRQTYGKKYACKKCRGEWRYE